MRPAIEVRGGVWLGLLGVGLGVLGLASGGLFARDVEVAAQGGDVGARVGEVVVVEGALLGEAGRMSIGGLSAWTYDGATWVRIGMQVDERGAEGGFVAPEEGDGYLDGADELVLLYEEAGARAPAAGRPGGMAGADVRAELELRDPLDGGESRWAYVFHGGQAGHAPAARLGWEAEARRIEAEAYQLGFAVPERDGYFGIASLRLFGDERDLVDRLKFRATLDLGGLPLTLTEEDLADPPLGLELPFDLDVDPVVVGPVRILIDAAGASVATPGRVSLLTGLEALGDLGGGGLPIELPLSNLRVSLDFTPAAEGALYRDANAPAGVTVDGLPDEVAEQPLPAWRELSHEAGRLLMLRGAPVSESEAVVYYEDDRSGDRRDTGDGESWADNGVFAEEATGFAGAGFPGELVFLPSSSPLDPNALLAAADAPLEVELAALEGRAPGPTVTPPVEATPTPGPTSLPEAGRAYLPSALR